MDFTSTIICPFLFPNFDFISKFELFINVNLSFNKGLLYLKLLLSLNSTINVSEMPAFKYKIFGETKVFDIL